MATPGVLRRAFLLLVATTLFLGSATLVWAAASDYLAYDLIPEGVSVAGTDISGLTRDVARAVIESSTVLPVSGPVTVRFQHRSFLLNARSIVSVNVEEMLDEAFSPKRRSTIARRIAAAVSLPMPQTIIEPVYSIDTTAIAEWVDRLAEVSIDRSAVDSTLGVEGNRPKISASKFGYRTNKALATQRIASAMLSDERSVYLPVSVLKPSVTESAFDRIVVVDKSERQLYLYERTRLDRKFPVAVGMPHYPTPLGAFEIVQKRYLPTWRNPGSAWASDMPDFIPPGPNNPLGTRALNLSASGIRIHGTNNIRSIGTAASHGCIRMFRSDIEWLYPRVSTGTPVFVVP